MAFPSDRKEILPILTRWCCGNEDAASFLMEIAEVARLADDVVDEEEHRQRNVCWLVSRLLTRIPTNKFFLAHIDRLAPSINTALNNWRLSDQWRKSGDRNREAFGFVLRESTDQIILAVAYLLGGHEHAFQVSQEIFEVCHAASQETVADWVGE